MSISKFVKVLVSAALTFGAIACDQPDQVKTEDESSFRLVNNSHCERYETMTICDLSDNCYDVTGTNWSAVVCTDEGVTCFAGEAGCITAYKQPEECYMSLYDVVDCIGALIAQAMCKTNPADCTPPDEEEDE